jgi:hypothetical protein
MVWGVLLAQGSSCHHGVSGSGSHVCMLEPPPWRWAVVQDPDGLQ